MRALSRDIASTLRASSDRLSIPSSLTYSVLDTLVSMPNSFLDSAYTFSSLLINSSRVTPVYVSNLLTICSYANNEISRCTVVIFSQLNLFEASLTASFNTMFARLSKPCMLYTLMPNLQNFYNPIYHLDYIQYYLNYRLCIIHILIRYQFPKSFFLQNFLALNQLTICMLKVTLP